MHLPSFILVSMARHGQAEVSRIQHQVSEPRSGEYGLALFFRCKNQQIQTEALFDITRLVLCESELDAEWIPPEVLFREFPSAKRGDSTLGSAPAGKTLSPLHIAQEPN